jgi:hypothetical protein
MRILHTMLRVAPGSAGRGAPQGIDPLEGCPYAQETTVVTLGGLES